MAVNAVPARQLALVPLELDACDAAVAGRRVGALLFRARPGGDFAGGFAERDASFSSSEARAAWLAVMALPTVAVVNRFSAEMCFSFGEWPTWWRRVREAGITTAEIAAGGAEPPADARWLPWGGGVARVPSRRARRAFGAAMVGAGDIRHSTWCYGEVIAGPDAPAVRAIGGVLASHGVNLALIATTDDGRYVTCNPHATLPAAAIAIASRKIATVLGGHLRRR